MTNEERIHEIQCRPLSEKLKVIKDYCLTNHLNCIEISTSYVEIDEKLDHIDRIYYRITRPHLVN